MNRIAQLDIFIEIDFVFRMTISRRYSFNVCIRTIDNFHSFFGKVIDDRLAAFCDVGEVRICQTSSFKFNLTICSSDSNMVTSNKVDFLIDNFDICTTSLSRPEIAGACQSRRGNLDVSIGGAGNSDVIAINEVQRAVFRNGLSIISIDLGFPADIL